jgi:hypothetical protein
MFIVEEKKVIGKRVLSRSAKKQSRKIKLSRYQLVVQANGCLGSDQARLVADIKIAVPDHS